MELGEKLRNARKERGLSQEQAAEALGVSRQTISNWETGKTYPDILCAIRMSDLYSVIWLSHSPAAANFGMFFRWGLLPLTALAVSFAAARCDYWGRGKWWLVPAWAAAFLLVPWTSYASGAAEAAFTFLWPGFRGLPIGALCALIGLGLGTLLRRRKPSAAETV